MNYVPFDHSDKQIDEEAVSQLIAKCPNFTVHPITFQRFKSIMKTILKRASKGPSKQFEAFLCQILEKVVTSVNYSFINEIKLYVMTWVHSLLPSYFVCELVRMKIVDQKELDREFSDLINAEPFNTKVMIHVMQTLYYGIIETSKLSPNEMISSLTLVCTIQPSQLDISKETMSARYTQI